MKRPLSAITYCKTHKLQVSTIVITIALALLIIGILQLFLDTLEQFYRKSYLSPNEHFSVVYHQYGHPLPDPSDVQAISPIPATEDQFPIYSILGKVNGRVWNVPLKNVPIILEQTKLSLTEGTLPTRPGEIAIPVQWALNRGIKVGDTTDLSFGATPKVKVVGMLSAQDVQCAVGVHLEEETSCYLYPNIQMLERDLATYKASNPDVLIENYASRLLLFNQLYHTTFLLGGLFVSILVLVIALICIHTLLSTHLHMRREEFSLLSAMGWNQKRLVLLFLHEVATYFIFAIISGGFAYVILGQMVQSLYFIPQGISIVWISPKGLIILIIMVLVSFFTLFLFGRKTVLHGVVIQNMIEGEI